MATVRVARAAARSSDDVEEWLQDFALSADRLRCPPRQALSKPVVDRSPDRVAGS
jgi:hypothetical protein